MLQLKKIVNNRSLSARYIGKLTANIASIPIYLLMEALLPRALGPQIYGNFNFATAIFTQFVGFLDMGTSTCFYNSLSRRQKESTLVTYYGLFSCVIFVITLLCGFLTFVPDIGSRFFPGVPLWYGPCAAIFGFLLWGTRVVRSMNDAIGLTVYGEILRAFVNIAGCIFLICMYILNILTDHILYIFHYISMSIIIFGCLFIVRKSWNDFSIYIDRKKISVYNKEFFQYSNPLFIQSLIVTLGIIIDRWLLQWFNGSSEQGYFALSQKISSACFLFISAMTPLVMRELAIAWGEKNTQKMGKLIDDLAPILFAVASWFSCFTCIEANFITRFFGGNSFAEALLAVQIMSFYPAHQAYGQVASSVFHATGKTKVLRNVAMVEHLIGFSLMWIFIAPSNLFGLGYGALGLALKTVITQIITVNLLLFLASQVVPLSYKNFLFNQISILSTMYALAYLSGQIGQNISFNSDILHFFTAGICYTLLTALAVCIFPFLFGIKRQHIQKITKFIR
ncbi:MAG: oligosaccharide flippase family protein [Desulfovibrionaceae bacterium]|nr:oligosaccharide flippase family protein [Desulfovibrionaceae bacterium]